MNRRMNRRRSFDLWLASRPRVIRVMGRALKPWHLYRTKVTGQVCRLYSFSEDGTVSVVMLTGHSRGFRVFGMSPADLRRLKPSEIPQELLAC